MAKLFLKEGGFNHGKENDERDILVGLFLFPLHTYFGCPAASGEGEKGNLNRCKSSY
jgi:hypothetical protein